MAKKKRKPKWAHKRNYKQNSQESCKRSGMTEDFELVGVSVSSNLLGSLPDSKEIEKYKKLGIFIDF